MSNNQILVSICCLSYNHVHYISECLESLLMQKCDFKFEILIHDDASTDGTKQIIKEFQKNYPEIVKPFFQEENQYSKGFRGLNTKYNFSRAKGKYIALCEGDDYWIDAYKLQKQVDFLEQNTEVVACQHDRYVLDKEQNLTFAKSKRYIFSQCLVFKNTIDADFIHFATTTNLFNGDRLLEFYLKSIGKYQHLSFTGAVYRYNGVGVFSQLTYLDQVVKGLDSFGKIYDFIDQSSYAYKKSVLKELRHKMVQNLCILRKQRTGEISIDQIKEYYSKYNIKDIKSLGKLFLMRTYRYNL